VLLALRNNLDGVDATASGTVGTVTLSPPDALATGHRDVSSSGFGGWTRRVSKNAVAEGALNVVFFIPPQGSAEGEVTRHTVRLRRVGLDRRNAYVEQRGAIGRRAA
jgi:hypothetical protein